MSDVKKINTNIQTNINLIKNAPIYQSNYKITPTMNIAEELIDFEEDVKEYVTKITDIEQLEGGNQEELIGLYEKYYIYHPETYKIISKYLGNDYTAEDVELLFSRIGKNGCGYVAATNIIMDYAVKNYTEEEFEKLFGFPMYSAKERKMANKNGDEIVFKLNTALMTLDFFLYYATNFDGNNTIEEIYGNAAKEVEFYERESNGDFETTGTAGTHSHEVGAVVQDYLKEKGINLDIITMYSEIPTESTDETEISPVHYESIGEWYYQDKVVKNGGKLVISAYDFTLYHSSDKDNNGKLDDMALENVGGHAMTVVGITNDGKFLVESWGREYLLDPEEVNGDGVKIINDYCVYKFK